MGMHTLWETKARLAPPPVEPPLESSTSSLSLLPSCETCNLCTNSKPQTTAHKSVRQRAWLGANKLERLGWYTGVPDWYRLRRMNHSWPVLRETLYLQNSNQWQEAQLSFVCLFVIAGRGLAYSGPQRWDVIKVQCASPGKEGNWLVYASVCVTCRVKEG